MYNYFKIRRFIKVQKTWYNTAHRELLSGKKESHWMWFILPQHKELGKSWRSKFYGIRNKTEVASYLGQPLLHDRYLECVGLIMRIDKNDLSRTFSSLDCLKLQSSLTLFHLESGDSIEVKHLTALALTKHYGGEYCKTTQALLPTDSQT